MFPEHLESFWGVFSAETPNIKFESLEKRVQDCMTIRKLIDDKAAIKVIFGKEIAFDTDRLTMIGHSYGGATTVEVVKRDNRIKHFVALDPWLFSVKEETLKGGIKDSVGLLLESGSWDKSTPGFEITKRNKQLVEASNGANHGIIYSKLQDTDHVSFADAPLSRPKLLQQRGFIKSAALSEILAKKILDFILTYMSIFVEKGANEPRLSEKVDTLKSSQPQYEISFQTK